MSDYVGPNSVAPGVYDLARERAGPNAFGLSNGLRLDGATAKWCNRDCLYAGYGSTNPVADVVVSNFHGYDAGRAGCSIVFGRDIRIKDSTFEHVAHTLLNCEPSAVDHHCDNIEMWRINVGDCGYFMLGSKGYPGQRVTVVMEDIRSLPDTSVGNLVWIDGDWSNPNTSLTLRRIAVKVRHSISDQPKINRADGTRWPMGDRTKAVYALNTHLVLEDVWIDEGDGLRPITRADVDYNVDPRWVGNPEPMIVFTDWEPISTPDTIESLRAQVVALLARVAALDADVVAARARVAALVADLDAARAQVPALTSQVAALTAEAAARETLIEHLRTEVQVLTAKIDAATAALA